MLAFLLKFINLFAQRKTHVIQNHAARVIFLEVCSESSEHFDILSVLGKTHRN